MLCCLQCCAVSLQPIHALQPLPPLAPCRHGGLAFLLVSSDGNQQHWLNHGRSHKDYFLDLTLLPPTLGLAAAVASMESASSMDAEEEVEGTEGVAAASVAETATAASQAAVEHKGALADAAAAGAAAELAAALLSADAAPEEERQLQRWLLEGLPQPLDLQRCVPVAGVCVPVAGVCVPAQGR